MNFPVKGSPKDHQVRVLSESGMKPGHAYFVDPGGGKTFCAIAEVGKAFENGDIDGVLVVAPIGVHAQWIEQQFPLWADFEWHGITNKATPKTIRDYMRHRKMFGLSVLAVNTEAIYTPKNKALIANWVSMYPRYALIFDESHKAKDQKTATAQNVLFWALGATMRRILTGTPILNGIENLWAQYEIVKPGLAWPAAPVSRQQQTGKVSTFGFLGFRTHYCHTAPIPETRGAVMIVGYRNLDQLRQRVAPYVTRVEAREFGKESDPTFVEVPTPMSDEQIRLYRDMEETLRIQIEGRTITADNALVELGKLLQISAGFLYVVDDDGDRGEIPLSVSKLKAATSLIEQMEEPVLVWSPFRAQQEAAVTALRKRFPDRPVHWYAQDSGSVSTWQGQGNGIMVGSQLSNLGIGWNFQHCAANIYLSPTFSAGARWQSVARTDRMGQMAQVRVWDLVTPDSVEVKTVQAIARKEDLSRSHFAGLQELLAR